MKKSKEFRTVRGYQIINSEKRLLTASMEDYLEMIYRMCMEENYIRINQLADRLNVRPSSTTKTVQKLNILGLVDYERYGIIQLTDKGKELGEFLLKRHEIIEEFLIKLGVEEALLKDTEMLEHDMSLTTLKSIYALNKFFGENIDLLERYEEFKKEFQNDIERCFYK